MTDTALAAAEEAALTLDSLAFARAGRGKIRDDSARARHQAIDLTKKILVGSYMEALQPLAQGAGVSVHRGIPFAARLIEEADSITDVILEQSRDRAQSKAMKKLYRRWQAMERVESAVTQHLAPRVPRMSFSVFLGDEAYAVGSTVRAIMKTTVAIAGMRSARVKQQDT